MTRNGEPTQRAGIEVALLFAPWCAIVNQIGTDREPRKVYLALLGLAGLALAAPLLGRLIRCARVLERLRPVAAPVLAGCVIAFGWFHLQDFHDQVTAPRNLNRLVDIGENTYAAGKMFFEGGVNPYSFRGQIWHDLGGKPGVKVERGRTTLHGVSYKYGYPYFPGMFLSYEPFRQLLHTFNAIRIGNLVFVFASLVVIGLLAWRLAPRPDLPIAVLGMFASFLCAKHAGYDLYNLGVTDIVIPCYALLGYLAVERGRDLLSGVCLGMAQASKLLPGGMLFAIAFFWFPSWPRRLRFLAGFLAVVALVVGPFFLADPSAFFSATVLYYLSFYPDGDGSALYSTLPRPWRPAFQLVHLALIVLVMVLGLRRRRGDVGRLLLLSAVCYLAFLAGNKMFHLNYLWSIYAPVCAAYVLGLLPSGEGKPARAALTVQTEDKPAPRAV